MTSRACQANQTTTDRRQNNKKGPSLQFTPWRSNRYANVVFAVYLLVLFFKGSDKSLAVERRNVTTVAEGKRPPRFVWVNVPWEK
jgi:hypothetical protein